MEYNLGLDVRLNKKQSYKKKETVTKNIIEITEGNFEENHIESYLKCGLQNYLLLVQDEMGSETVSI